VNWDFRVKGFAGPKHPRCTIGTELGETTHRGVSSLQMEIEVWQSRCKDGSALYCQIIDLRPGGNLTSLRVDHHTKFDWQKIYAEGMKIG
jgi:hypothetical protein